MKLANIELLNRQEQKLNDYLDWIGKEGIKNLLDSYKEINSYVNQITILSAGIAGVVIPLLIEQEKTKIDLIYLSFSLFTVNIIFGVVYMSTFVTGLPDAHRSITERQQKRLLNFINRIQEIRRIEDDNIAGKDYETFLKEVVPETQTQGNISWKNKLRRILVFETWFFAIFIGGLLSLFISFLLV